jgi:hypothetical protein
MYRSSLLRLYEEMPSSGAYSRTFGSLGMAFRNLCREQRTRARVLVKSQLHREFANVLAYSGSGSFAVTRQKNPLRSASAR